MNDHAKARCYIGRCKCGNIVAATVIDLDGLTPERQASHMKDVRKDVADFMREGLSIEQMDVEEVRKSFASCTCPKPEKPKKPSPQASLL